MGLTETEILEGNTLIARFMGCPIQLHLVEHPFTREYVDFDELQFHSSWDWLMDIIQELSTIEFPSEPISNVSLYSSIEEVFKEVVEAIKYYNKNIKLQS